MTPGPTENVTSETATTSPNDLLTLVTARSRSGRRRRVGRRGARWVVPSRPSDGRQLAIAADEHPAPSAVHPSCRARPATCRCLVTRRCDHPKSRGAISSVPRADRAPARSARVGDVDEHAGGDRRAEHHEHDGHAGERPPIGQARRAEADRRVHGADRRVRRAGSAPARRASRPARRGPDSGTCSRAATAQAGRARSSVIVPSTASTLATEIARSGRAGSTGTARTCRRADRGRSPRARRAP